MYPDTGRQWGDRAVVLRFHSVAILVYIHTSAKEVMFSSTFVCLLAGLRRKLFDRCSQNSAERRHMDRGGND